MNKPGLKIASKEVPTIGIPPSPFSDGCPIRQVAVAPNGAIVLCFPDGAMLGLSPFDANIVAVKITQHLYKQVSKGGGHGQ